jgi:tetratricopeptide (TPR) repeat protein
MSSGLVTITKPFDFTLPDRCMNEVVEACQNKQWYRIDSCRAQLSQLTDSQGKSLLMRAIELKDDRLTEEFVCRGISLSMKDKSGNTALHYAAESGVSQYITLLLPHCAIDDKNSSDQTPFDLAKSAKKANVFVSSILSKAHCCLKSRGAPDPTRWLEALLPSLEKNYEKQHENVGLCLRLLGHCYYKQNEYAKALEAFKRAQEILEKKPLNEVSLAMMGDCYYETGAYREAMELFEWLHRIGAQTYEAQYLLCLGLCYEELGKVDEAGECFNQIKKLHKQERIARWANRRACINIRLQGIVSRGGVF